MRQIVLAALTAAVVTLGALCAQEEPAPPSGSELLARLRADALTPAEARALAAHLPSQPIGTRLAACDALQQVFVARTRDHGKQAAELQKLLTKASASLFAARLGKAGADAVAAARSAALAKSRAEGLTKERIQSEIDPLVEELRAKLWCTRDELAAAEPAIAEQWSAIQRQRGELAEWYAAFVLSTVDLELHPQAQKHFAKSPAPPAPAPVAALDDEWIVWTMLATPLSARDRKALEQNETLRAAADAEEFAGTTALNRIRFLLGLPLLRIDDKLTRAARDHSTDMSTLGFFDHTSPVPGKRTPGDRAAKFGTSGGAENIAAGHDTGPSAVRGWWYSPGHHKNMLGGHARVGLGRYEQTWTQMFGG